MIGTPIEFCLSPCTVPSPNCMHTVWGYSMKEMYDSSETEHQDGGPR